MVFAIHGAGHHADVAEELICSIVRVAVHITMLFSGDSKSWLSAFNREQNAATIFGRLLPNLYEARFPRTNAIPCFRWKFGDYFRTEIVCARRRLELQNPREFHQRAKGTSRKRLSLPLLVERVRFPRNLPLPPLATVCEHAIFVGHDSGNFPPCR
jgi:hypothetical protein